MECISSRIEILGITEANVKTRLSRARLQRCPRRRKRQDSARSGLL